MLYISCLIFVTTIINFVYALKLDSNFFMIYKLYMLMIYIIYYYIILLYYYII